VLLTKQPPPRADGAKMRVAVPLAGLAPILIGVRIDMTLRRLALVLAAAALLCVYFGWLPRVDDSARTLLHMPGSYGRPVHMERDEALMLVFFCVFLSPFAAFMAAVLLGLLIAMVAGLIRPVVLAVRLPSAVATLISTGAWSVALYVWRQAWLPPSRWMVEVLSRAYQVAFT
jgi:hypothetical protein